MQWEAIRFSSSLFSGIVLLHSSHIPKDPFSIRLSALLNSLNRILSRSLSMISISFSIWRLPDHFHPISSHAPRLCQETGFSFYPQVPRSRFLSCFENLLVVCCSFSHLPVFGIVSPHVNEPLTKTSLSLGRESKYIKLFYIHYPERVTD